MTYSTINVFILILILLTSTNLRYPSLSDLAEICTQLVATYEKLKDVNGGFNSWKRQLQFKFENERKKLPITLKKNKLRYVQIY